MLFRSLSRLVKITLKHKDQNLLDKASTVLAKRLKSALGKQVLGPEYPLIIRIKNLYQKDILIKLPVNKQLHEWKNFIYAQTKELLMEQSFKQVKINIDVDPY